MDTLNLKIKASDAEVDQVIDGLTGDLRIGARYYFFTVTYAYIGRITKLTDRCVTIGDVEIVMNAGSANDAVSKIVNGKATPEVSEKPGKPVIIFIQSLTAVIPF